MGKENMGQSSSAHTGEDQESGSVEAMRVIPSLGQQGVSASRTTVRNKNQAEVQHAWWSPRSVSSIGRDPDSKGLRCSACQG